MGLMNQKLPTAIKGTMKRKNIFQLRDICWCNDECGSIFSAATVQSHMKNALGSHCRQCQKQSPQVVQGNLAQGPSKPTS
jgi:Zn finger protein HypA/HybF involved in hydrogenase expression